MYYEQRRVNVIGPASGMGSAVVSGTVRRLGVVGA